MVVGHVLNLETQDVKMETWDGSYDPDSTSWLERGSKSNVGNCYIWVTRLFFEVGPPAYEVIGKDDRMNPHQCAHIDL